MKGALKRNTCLEELELVRTRVESQTLEDICPVLGELPSFKSFIVCEDYSIYKSGWQVCVPQGCVCSFCGKPVYVLGRKTLFFN